MIRDEHGKLDGDKYFITYCEIDGEWKEVFRNQLKSYMEDRFFDGYVSQLW